MRTLVSVCVLALVAQAADTTPLDEAIDQVTRVLKEGDYIAVSTAFRRATALRPQYSDADFMPLAKAIAEGARHRDPSIAILSVKTLGELRTRGSGAYLNRLLSPPSSMTGQELDLHLAAIDAAGKINDEESLPRLLKLILHKNMEIAIAGCKALTRYKWLDAKPRVQLIKKMTDLLGRLEKKRPKKALDRQQLEYVKNALVDSLRELTRDRKLSTSSEFREWILKAVHSNPL